MTEEFPVATTSAPGLAGVDWENRVDFERLRNYRLARVREQLETSELGALLLFETSNIRYATSTHIGYWAFNKGERYALVTRTGAVLTLAHLPSHVRHGVKAVSPTEQLRQRVQDALAQCGGSRETAAKARAPWPPPAVGRRSGPGPGAP